MVAGCWRLLGDQLALSKERLLLRVWLLQPLECASLDLGT